VRARPGGQPQSTRIDRRCHAGPGATGEKKVQGSVFLVPENVLVAVGGLFQGRLASSCCPALPNGIGYPQGFNERFHILEMIHLSRASWRKAGHRARFASPDGNNGVKNALLIHLSFPLEIV
jgi:hypothetical protein